jgi:hypothetical protein
MTGKTAEKCHYATGKVQKLSGSVRQEKHLMQHIEI